MIELITKPNCPLCQQAREVLARVARDIGISWTEVSTSDQSAFGKKYREEIPVLLVDGKVRDFWTFDESRLRKILSALNA